MMSLIESVFRNDLSRLEQELSEGANPDERDGDERTPLIHAATNNYMEAAELLLRTGANVDAQDKLGNTALHYAAQDHHPDMASLLLSHGAQIDPEDTHGNTPLWKAVFNSRGRGDLIVMLLKAGADRNHRNNRDRTPMDLAKTIANYEISKFFA